MQCGHSLHFLGEKLLEWEVVIGMSEIKLTSIFEFETVNNKIVPQLFKTFPQLTIIKEKPFV